MRYRVTIEQVPQDDEGYSEYTTSTTAEAEGVGVSVGAALRALNPCRIDQEVAQCILHLLREESFYWGDTQEMFTGHRNCLTRLFDAARDIEAGWDRNDSEG